MWTRGGKEKVDLDVWRKDCPDKALLAVKVDGTVYTYPSFKRPVFPSEL